MVHRGSRARVKEVASTHEYVRTLRAELLARDVMMLDGDAYVFQQDYRF